MPRRASSPRDDARAYASSPAEARGESRRRDAADYSIELLRFYAQPPPLFEMPSARWPLILRALLLYLRAMMPDYAAAERRRLCRKDSGASFRRRFFDASAASLCWRMPPFIALRARLRL